MTEQLPDPPPDELGEQVTLLLDRLSAGDGQASVELLPIVYDELRKVARWRMSRERPGQTLQATALVHEAYLRLVSGSADGEQQQWQNRRHFFGAAAEAMRRILIERARRYSRNKHGGGQERVDFEVAEAISGTASEEELEELLTLDQALSSLEQRDSEMATIVKLKHFAGFSTSEIVEAFDVSERTVHRKWSAARAWLKKELSSTDSTDL